MKYIRTRNGLWIPGEDRPYRPKGLCNVTMFPMDHGISHRSAGGAPITVTFTANAVSGTDLTTYTFSALSLGTAQSNRRIVVGAGGIKATDASLAISSVTVAGSSATQLKSQLHSTANGAQISTLWMVALPSGTSGDVVVTFNTGVIRAGVGVWAVYGASATVFADAASTAKPLALTINVAAGGGVIAYAGVNNTGGAFPTVTWTNLTEKFDQEVEAGAGVTTHSGASDEFAAAETARAVSADYTGTESFQAGVAVSLQSE